MNRINNNRGFSLLWVIGIVTVTSIISAITAGVIVYNNNKLSYDLTYEDLSKDNDLNEFLTVYAHILSEYYKMLIKVLYRSSHCRNDGLLRR